MNSGLVIHDEDYRQVMAVCNRLTRDAGARIVFLVDKNGQLIASCGSGARDVDTTSLASLTAGNVAAMGGLAKLIGEKEFPTQFHEGERVSLHMSVVGGRAVLVVVFDASTSLGLVRLRVKKACEELSGVFEGVSRRQTPRDGRSPFAEITDDDIDHLFDRT